MRMLVSFAALFVSVILLQLGLGGVAPFDAISGVLLGFSTTEIGVIGSAHFLGFFIGCWWAPRLMGEVGHSRAFAAFTAAGTIGILAHMMIVDPWAWSIFRMAAGLSVAGCYTIIEAWLQGKVTNANRGRAMGVYRIVDIIGSLGAQMVVAFLEPATYFSYNLLALMCCAALFPLVLSRAEAPVIGAAPRLRPRMAWARSPLAAVGVIIGGLSSAAFRMVGPVYGVSVGMANETIALFLGAYVVGGAIAQYPVGWAADRFDRRSVLIAQSLASILACAAMAMAGDIVTIFLSACFFGFATMPIYSIATAHAHDFAEPHERVELSAALMFLFAVGAIASPLIASVLIDWFGPGGMFGFIASSHVAMVAFGLWRMRARPAPEARNPYTWIPRTTFWVWRLFGRSRDD